MTKTLKLRYDGKWDFIEDADPRQWTILSHFIDANGQDRIGGSFGLSQLLSLLKEGN